MRSIKKGLFGALFLLIGTVGAFADVANVSDWATFRARYLDLLDGSTINVMTNLPANLAENLGATTKNNLTIKGNNNSVFELNGNQKLGFILVNKQMWFADLSLTNFLNGTMTISNRSTITFSGTMKFINNKNTLENGGALSITNSSVTFSNSLVTFSGNSVQRNAEEKHAGGALFITALYTPNKENVSNGRTNVDFLSATLNVTSNSVIINGSGGDIYTPSPQGAGMFVGGVLSDIGNDSNASVVSSVIGTLSMNLHLTAINISSNTITNSYPNLYANSSQGAGLFVGGAIGASNRNQTVIASTGVVTMSFSSSSVNIIGNKIYVSGATQNQGSLSQGGGFFAGGAVAVGAVINSKESYVYATSATVMISFSSENVKITSNTISANSTTSQGQGTTLQGAGLFVGGVVGGGLRTGGHLKATSATVSVDFNSSDINISHNVLVPSGTNSKIASQGGGLFVGGAVAGGASESGNSNNIYVINGTASVNIRDSRISISSNSAWQGGGMFIVGSGISGIDGTNNILADMGTAIVLFQNSTATFIGNSATNGNGGAIYIAANDKTNSTGSGIARNGKAILSFVNSSVSFISNKTANNTGGGAIYAEAGASITFSNSQVNFASNTVGTSGSGGAILITGGSTLTFNNSTANFISNSANGSGGAIYVSGNYSNLIFMGSSVTFINNRTVQGGGAAVWVSGNSEVTFTNTKVSFTSNATTNGSGGAIFATNEAKVIFTGSSVSFIDNRGNEAGAIWNDSSFIDFNNSTVTFIRNFSQIGAVEMNGVSTLSFTKSQVDFIDNYAAYAGGVFAFRFSMESRVLLTSSVVNFSGNYATGGVGGGVAYIGQGSISVIDSTVNFVNNWAIGGTTGGGVIIVENSAIINFTNSLVNFTSNAAINNKGGVISANAGATYINFIGSTVGFTRNTANTGGAFYLEGNNKFLTFIGSSVTFTENKAVSDNTKGGGGVINIQGSSSITFTDSQVSFTSNSAIVGGVARLNNKAGLIVTGSTMSFINNFVTIHDGGVFYIEGTSTVTFINSSVSFISNSAVAQGGVLLANQTSKVTFVGSTVSFVDNKVTGNGVGGGAIYLQENSELTFANSSVSFTNNLVSQNYGGAISAANTAKISFTNTVASFVDNSAKTRGGAIYVTGSSIKLIFAGANIIFAINHTDVSGGAIYTSGGSSTAFTNTNVSFTNNSSEKGGAIFAEGNSLTYLINSTVSFIGNIATNGGAVGASASATRIVFAGSFVDFRDNIATSGAGLYANDSSLITLNNTTVSFIHNTATNGGGAISLDTKAGVIFNNSTVSFSGNSANTNGGALYLAGGSTITFNAISDILFVDNTAADIPNDIYLSASRLILNANAYQIRIEGGIVATAKSTITFRNATGGYLYLTGGNDFENMGQFNIANGSMTVADATFTYRNSVNGQLRITNSSLNSSLATFVNSSVTFVNNSANGTSSQGGAIYVNGTLSRLIFTGSTVSFINNRATGGAGAIWLEVGFVDFNNTTVTFINNYGGNYGYYGGVITVDGNSTISFTRSKVVFMDNSSNDDGGVFATRFNPESRIIFSSSVVDFSGNFVNARDVVGGGVINFHHGRLSVIDSTINFVNNWSNGGVGGGVISIESSATVNFSNSIVNFTSNAAKNSNGGVIIDNESSNTAYINFIGSTVSFASNSANNGGVIYLQKNTSLITFIDSQVSFTSNSGSTNGGVIYATNGSKIAFNNTPVSFIVNSGNQGGAIYSNNAGEIKFENSSTSFIGNKATNGGAIYANINGAIRFENSTSSFMDNSASNGGAIYINNNSTITFVNSSASFIGNRANQGGTIYIANSVINFAHPNSTLSFINSSATYGGAIYINNANVTFDDLSSEISFRDNNAALDGGAIYIANGSTLTIAVDIGLVGNSANQFGGAIYNDARLIVDSSLEDIVFSGNIGRKGTEYETGSDIYNTEKGTVTIRGTKNVFIESGLRGFGDVNKEGSGTLYIDGNSFRFSGNFNQNEGQTIVSTAYFSGVTNINKGSIVLDNGTVFAQGVKINIGEEGILYVSLTAGNSIDFIAGITITTETTGSRLSRAATGGLIIKNEDGQLDITGDFSGSMVRFEQYAGTTTVQYNPISMPKGKIFGGINYIENSLLQITADSMYYKVEIGDNGRLENRIFRNSAAGDLITDKKIRFVGNAGTVTFTNVGSELVDYRLQSIGNQTGSAGNYVIFKGPSIGSVLPVRVRIIDPRTFKSNNISYIFDHVTLDLTEMEDANVQTKSVKTVSFDHLQSIDSSLRFGFNMRYTGAVPPSSINPVTDKALITINVDQLIVKNGDGVFLNMSDIMSYNIINQDVLPLDMSKEENYWTWGYEEDIKVLDGIQFNEDAKATIFGVVYTYNISAVKGRGNNYEKYTNIILTITPPPGERLYVAANVTPKERSFNHYPTGSILVDGSIAEDYHIKRDFNNPNDGTSTTTLAGSLLVFGDRGEAKDIIISGIIVNAENPSINGTSGSFFSFDSDSGSTRLTVQNVTIRDALKIEGSQKGSVLYIPKPETPEGLGYRLAGTFIDAIIKQNESQDSGGAVYADRGVLTVNGTKFISNKARSGSGGAIYMSDVSIDYSNNSIFSGNSAGGNGGAIYMTISTMTNNGGQIDFLANSAGGDGGAIYASKVLTGFTNGKVNFIGNTAGNSNDPWNNSRGGAVYVEDSVVGLGSPIFRDNKSTGNGGAIYVSGSGAAKGVYTSTLTIVAVTQNVEFSNNKMNAAGTIENNDIYVEGNAIVRLETRSADMRITGGVQGGNANSKILKFGSGELNFGGTINFGGTLEVKEGTLRLGQMKPKVHPYNPTIPTDEMYIGGDLIIREGALWSSLNGNKDYIYVGGNMTLEGILRFYMEFDLDTTDIIEVYGDQGIFIDKETAQFDLGILGHNSVVIGSSVNIFLAHNGIIRGIESGDVTGRFGRIEYEVVLNNNRKEAWVVVTNKLTIDIPGLTPNQDTVSDLLETIGDGVIDDVQNPILEDFENGNFQGVKEKLDKISGAFVTNSISMAARNNNSDTVMARMTKAIPSQITSFPKNTLFGQISKANAQKVALDRKWRWGDRDKYLPIWVEANINGLNISGNKTTLGDFKSTGYGVQAGADLWFGDYSVRGVYAGVNKKNMKQGSDKTKAIDMELGAYGAYMFNKIGVRGVFGLGVQNFQTERYLDFVAGGVSPKADFYTFSARFAGEVEYTIRSYRYDFKPFIGVQGGYVINNDIEETGGGQANLIMGADSHLRLAGLAGLKMENKKDNQNLYLKGNINWYSKAFIGYLFTGNESEYDVRFAQAKDAGTMKVTALDEGDIFGGLGAGLEYNISERVTAYTDGQLTFSQYMVDYSLGAGMRYQFDQKKINEQVANMNRPTEEDMLNAEILGLTESKAAKKARLKAEKAAQKELERAVKLAGTSELVGTAGMLGTAEIVTTSEISTTAEMATTVETSTQVQTQAQGQGQIEGTDPINEAMQEAKTEVELKETIASFSVTASQFETDSFTLKAKGKELLTELALKIKGMRFNSITIKGHTDSTGSKEYNQQLSIKRAKSVYDVLVSEFPQDKLKYEGYGQDFPKATNATKEGRAENRRVDIDVE